jgi:hypothetical protein
LDLKALSDYQQIEGSTIDAGNKVIKANNQATALEENSRESNTKEWHCITPQLV